MTGTFDADETSGVKLMAPAANAKLVRKRSLRLNAQAAEKFLDLKAVPGDRPLIESHVNQLVAAMGRGTFRQELVTLARCRFGEEVYRINGQHTCWAVVTRAGEIDDFEITVDLAEYEAGSLDDVRQLYATFDRGKARTRSMLTHSYLAGTTAFDGVASQVLTLLPKGLSFWLWEDESERGRHDADDVVAHLLGKHLAVAQKVAAFLTGRNRSEESHICRAPVVAAMFATFNQRPQIAEAFWTQVGDGLGLNTADDPARRLKLYLENSTLGRRSQGSAGNPVSGEHMFRCCIHCWNKHRTGESIKQLKVREDTERPAVAD